MGVGGGQAAGKGEMCVWDGESSRPLGTMSQFCSYKPQSGGKGIATAHGAFVIWGCTHSGAVKDRGSKGSDPPSWKPGQGQHELYRDPEWHEA